MGHNVTFFSLSIRNFYLLEFSTKFFQTYVSCTLYWGVFVGGLKKIFRWFFLAENCVWKLQIEFSTWCFRGAILKKLYFMYLVLIYNVIYFSEFYRWGNTLKNAKNRVFTPFFCLKNRHFRPKKDFQLLYPKICTYTWLVRFSLNFISFSRFL